MNYDQRYLNENQRAAINWDKGPLLILAGPGSGKTLVLTMHIAQLLLKSPDKHFRILGLTFTNKAAAEMRSRVLAQVPHNEDRVLLTTFHSFAADVLRQHGSHLGLQPDFVVLNQEEDRVAVLRDTIRMIRRQSLEITDEDIKYLPAIDQLLTRCASDDQLADLVPNPPLARKLALLYSGYRQQLIENNRLDFASLLFYADQILRQKPMIARQLRLTYAHVCVDEFQDTNLAQYRLLRALVGDDFRNLYVVADDDQIIYQWNGASPERLRTLRDDFNMSVIQLPANYRCPRDVIQLANRLIQHNSSRFAEKQPLYAVRDDHETDTIRVRQFASQVEEIAWVASDIRENRSQAPGKCVVLARRRRLLDLAVGEILKQGMKAFTGLRRNEFVSVPVRWLHATLRLANTRSDREQLRRMCSAFYELTEVMTELDSIVAFAPENGGDYLRTWIQMVRRTVGSSPSISALLDGAETQIVDRLDVLGFCKSAFNWIDTLLDDEQSSHRYPDYPEERTMWHQLQSEIVRKHPPGSVTLNSFLQELDLAEKTPPAPTDAVLCLTIHGAKGLEFDHVYLVGMVEDELPAFQAIRKGALSHEMQEERRNCFVAITRAHSTLTITYANRYFGWAKQPSRFLQEMGLVDLK